MLALLCFCVATEFSANKDLYKPNYDSWQIKPLLKKALFESEHSFQQNITR